MKDTNKYAHRLVVVVVGTVVACSVPGKGGSTLAGNGDSEWKYSEKIDPITTQTVRSVISTVGDPDAPNLIADVAFSCSPKEVAHDPLFGPPYFEITTYERPDTTGKTTGVAIDASSLEFRFNGRPISVGLGVVQRFANSVTMSLHRLNAGGDLSAEAGPIFVPDPNFVVRVRTAEGEFTYSTSLKIRAIAKVLTACGVRFERAPVKRVEQLANTPIDGAEHKGTAAEEGAAGEASGTPALNSSLSHTAVPDPTHLPSVEDFYPPASQRLGEQGIATVNVCVGPNGRLIQRPTIAKSSGHSRLDEAAVRLALAGRFLPGTDKDGKPIASCTTMNVGFKLQ